MTYEHPMRRGVLHVFERLDHDGTGFGYIAKFYPYHAYPMFFHGATREEVTEKAEAFRAEAVEKNEAAYAARQVALEKARAKRKAKKEAAE